MPRFASKFLYRTARGLEVGRRNSTDGSGGVTSPWFSSTAQAARGSTDRDQRDTLIFFISGDAHGPRVEHRLAIDQEVVVMMAVVEGNPQLPGAIWLSLHPMKIDMPIIEIAGHCNCCRLGCNAEEVDRLGHVPGGITVVEAARLAGTNCVRGLHLVKTYLLENSFQQVSR